MKKSFLDLTIKEFTYLLLGCETDHYATPVDSLFSFKDATYLNIVSYLKRQSDNWDKDLLIAIRADMETSFDEFLMWQIDDARGCDIPTPKMVIWDKGDGETTSVVYANRKIRDMNTVELNADMTEFESLDALQLFDTYRDFLVFEGDREKLTANQAAAIVFSFMQKMHFRKHTHYAIAMDVIRSHINDERMNLNRFTGDIDTSTPSNTDSMQPVTDNVDASTMLPPEYTSTTARKYIDKAIKAGLIPAALVNGVYGWNGNKKGLALFCDLLSEKCGFSNRKWIVSQQAFGVGNLAQAMGKARVVGKFGRNENTIKGLFDG